MMRRVSRSHGRGDLHIPKRLPLRCAVLRLPALPLPAGEFLTQWNRIVVADSCWLPSSLGQQGYNTTLALDSTCPAPLGKPEHNETTLPYCSQLDHGQHSVTSIVRIVCVPSRGFVAASTNARDFQNQQSGPDGKKSATASTSCDQLVFQAYVRGVGDHSRKMQRW